MERCSFQSLVYYQFESLAETGLRHGVFTRVGGVSEGIYRSLNLSRSTGDALEPVRENRRRMFEALAIRPEQSLTSWLVHSNTVRVVSETDLGQDDVHADAMITRTRGLALTLRFADCVPVLFFDPQRQVIGIAHAGWVGFTVGVLPATVQAMCEAYGCDPHDIRACVGPSIGPDKFEVGEDVAARIQAAVPEPVVTYPRSYEHDPHSRANGNAAQQRESFAGISGEALNKPKPHVDLWCAAQAQLRAAGVGQVQIAGLCTASNTAEWFSHRAEKGKTGRFGAVIEMA
ncbi:MAG TPA: peptidoglycan editing factor PgeF [Anaerolineae bacterium]